MQAVNAEPDVQLISDLQLVLRKYGSALADSESFDEYETKDIREKIYERILHVLLIQVVDLAHHGGISQERLHDKVRLLFSIPATSTLKSLRAD